MEQRGESLLRVVLPKYKPETLFCQGLCSRVGTMLQRRELWSSSQPPWCYVGLWDLHKQPQCRAGLWLVFSGRLVAQQGMAEGQQPRDPGRELRGVCCLPCPGWSLALRVQLGKDVNQSNDRGSRRGRKFSCAKRWST